MLMTVDDSVAMSEVREKTFELRALALQSDVQTDVLIARARELASLNQKDDPIATQSILMGLRAIWDETSERQNMALAVTAELANQASPFSYAARHFCHEWKTMAVATPAASSDSRFQLACTAFHTAASPCFKQAAAGHIIGLSTEQPSTLQALNDIEAAMTDVHAYATMIDHQALLTGSGEKLNQTRAALHLMM